MKSNKMDKDIFCKRAVMAREAAGFTLAKAAELLSFNNYQTLSKIEKGERNINAHELNAMALIYGRKIDYFFEQDIHSDPVPLWRKTQSADIKPIQRNFFTFLEHYSNLETLLKLKKRWKDIRANYDKEDFSFNGFELAGRIGNNVRKFLDLGSRPAFTLKRVLENDLRIKIFQLPLSNGISGACVVDKNLGAGILINANDKPWRRNYDMAHELFHIVTWDVFSHEEVGNGTTKTRPEKFADIFASSLLLPERHLTESFNDRVINNQLELIDAIEIAKEFGVSTPAILWRLVNLKRIKKKDVEKVLEDPLFSKTDRQNRQNIVDSQIKSSKYPARYIYLSYRCLKEGKISRGVFSKYLDIDRSEVDSYLGELGLMDENYEKITVA